MNNKPSKNTRKKLERNFFMEALEHEIELSLAKHYSNQLSKSIKRGLRAKKLSTSNKLQCKPL